MARSFVPPQKRSPPFGQPIIITSGGRRGCRRPSAFISSRGAWNVNGGRTRKCFSLLGTWRGEAAERPPLPRKKGGGIPAKAPPASAAPPLPNRWPRTRIIPGASGPGRVRRLWPARRPTGASPAKSYD